MGVFTLHLTLINHCYTDLMKSINKCIHLYLCYFNNHTEETL